MTHTAGCSAGYVGSFGAYRTHCMNCLPSGTHPSNVHSITTMREWHGHAMTLKKTPNIRQFQERNVEGRIPESKLEKHPNDQAGSWARKTLSPGDLTSAESLIAPLQTWLNRNR